MTIDKKALEALFVDAIGPHRFIDPRAAAEAGVPRKFIESVRHRSLHVVDADQAREAAESFGETIDDDAAATRTLDPAELAQMLERY